MRLKFDFTAPASRTFGVVVPIDTLVDAIPDALDVWAPTEASVTLASGRISAWTGRKNGRVLAQGNSARQPTLSGGRVKMSDDTGAAGRCLDLVGTQIGTTTALTIAGSVEIHPAAILTDLHYIFGSPSPACALAYRYFSGSKYLRFYNATQSIDVALPAEFDGRVGFVLSVNGAAFSAHLTTGGSSTATLSAAFNMASLSVGKGQAAAAGDLPGSIGNFGIWNRAVTAGELATLLSWVG